MAGLRKLWATFALIAALARLALGSPTLAQTVQQSGPVVPFDLPVWTGNGVIADGGGPAAPAVGQLGLFNGGNCPFGVTSQTGPGQTTVPVGQFLICQTPTTTTLVVQGLNGQATPAFFVNIGGVNYAFPGAGNGNVVGPGSATGNDFVCFNSTTGKLVQDCGFGAANVAITGGAINGAVIGGSTPAAATFTTETATTNTAATVNATSLLKLNGVTAESATAPVVASGFGTGAAVANANGTVAFTVGVGTSNAGTGVITMPAAAHGWACSVNDLTTKSATVFVTQVTATTSTSVTVQNYSDAAATHAWVDSDVLQFLCGGY